MSPPPSKLPVTNGFSIGNSKQLLPDRLTERSATKIQAGSKPRFGAVEIDIQPAFNLIEDRKPTLCGIGPQRRGKMLLPLQPKPYQSIPLPGHRYPSQRGLVFPKINHFQPYGRGFYPGIINSAF